MKRDVLVGKVLIKAQPEGLLAPLGQMRNAFVDQKFDIRRIQGRLTGTTLSRDEQKIVCLISLSDLEMADMINDLISHHFEKVAAH